MPDPELVERVDSLGVVEFEEVAFRHMGPGYPPLSGEGARIAGGRWNPPNSFPVLYMGLDLETIVAEFYRAAQRHGRPPEDFLPRKLCRYDVRLSAALDLREQPVLSAVELTDADLRGNDLRACQAIGEAAHYLGLEGILAPSAVGPGVILATFYSKLRGGSFVRDVAEELWTSPP